YRRYCYGQQPSICYLNLELLQEPLKAVIDPVDLDYGLAKFQEYYHAEYGNLMLKRLGFAQPKFPEADDLLDLTIGFLKESQINYHQFFADMAKTFSPRWREEPSLIMEESQILPGSLSVFKNWCALYHQVLNNSVSQEMANVGTTLIQYNPQSNLLRPVIEEIW
ncbi:YdiU family protein, partial [Cylindrospermopsis raciborskii CS-506_A]